MLLEILLSAAMAAPQPADIHHEVVCAETGFSRSAEAKDESAFVSFVDPDARFITNSVARGREEIANAWSVFLSPDGPTIRWRPAVVEVSSDGNLAISRGPFRITSIDESGATQYSWGHFMSTWRRNSEGTWQVLFDTGGDSGMTPTEADIAALESEPDCP
jgi:ketosteroid isomerase-like protein